MVMVTVTTKEIRRIRLFGVDIEQEVTIEKTIEKKNSKALLPPSLPPPQKSIKLFGVVIPIPNSPHKPQTPPRKRRKIKITQEIPIVRPELPVSVRGAIANMGGTEIVFLTEKTLEVSDTKENLNRLFIPKTGTIGIMKALTENEKRIIGISEDGIIQKTHSNNNRAEGKLQVLVIDGKENRYDMTLTVWRSLAKLVLIKEWIKFVQVNNLEAGNCIQLWCFRQRDSRLSFAVVKKEPEAARDDSGAATLTAPLQTSRLHENGTDRSVQYFSFVDDSM